MCENTTYQKITYDRRWDTSTGSGSGVGTTYGNDFIDVAAINAQGTHLIGRRVEADFNGAVEWALNAHSGLKAAVARTEVAASQPSLVRYQGGQSR